MTLKNENSIKAQNIYMQDVEKNNFKIELAHINTYSNELSGKDISINLNNVFFDKNNEPRFKGKSIKYQIEVDFAKFKGDTYIDEIEEIIDGDLSKITEKMEFESFLVDAYASIKIPKIKKVVCQ